MDASLLMPTNAPTFEWTPPKVTLKELWVYSQYVAQRERMGQRTMLQEELRRLRVRMTVLSGRPLEDARQLGVFISQQMALLPTSVETRSPFIPEGRSILREYVNRALLEMKRGQTYWHVPSKEIKCLNRSIQPEDLWRPDVLSLAIPTRTRLPLLYLVKPGDAYFARYPPTGYIGAAHITDVDHEVKVIFDEDPESTYTLRWLNAALACKLPGEIIKLADAQDFVPSDHYYPWMVNSRNTIWPYRLGDLTAEQTLDLLDYMLSK